MIGPDSVAFLANENSIRFKIEKKRKIVQGVGIVVFLIYIAANLAL